MRRHAISAAVLTVALASCGGGSHTLPSTSSAGTSSAHTGTAHFSVLIPNAPAVSSTTRRAQYISASTQSGTILSGGVTSELNLGAGSPLCTTATNGRTCLISAPAPIGASDSFTLALYDGAYTSNAHSGTLLSTGAFTSAVAEGTANVTVPLVLSGAVASYQLVVTQQPVAYSTSGAGAQGTAVLDVYDTDGNLIVGPGTFVTTSGTTETFTLAATPTHAQYSINGGAYAASGLITQTSDTIAFKQTTIGIGAELSVTPSVAVTQRASAWMRPTGLSAGNVEGANVNSGAATLQIAPLVDNTEGIAMNADIPSTGGIYLTSGGGVSITNPCNNTVQRAGDMAYSVGTAWMPNLVDSATLFTIGGTGLCGTNSQFPAVTGFGVANTGIQFLTAACTYGTMVPGVFENQYTTAPNCTKPHDMIPNGATYAALETNSVSGKDDMLIFAATTLTSDLPMTYSATTAAGGTLTTAAPRADGYDFVHEIAAKRLWSVNTNAPQAVTGFTTLSASYTYANNSLVQAGNAYSARSMAIGADGLAYIAVSAPYNGVAAIDPTSGVVVLDLPNTSSASAQPVTNVIADNRGTIYWNAGNDIMHYPNNLP